MTKRSVQWILLALVLVTVDASWAEGSEEEESLLALNERVLHAYVVEGDTGPLEEIALPEMVVMTPGGREDLATVLAGVDNLDIDEMVIEKHVAGVSGDTATVTGVMALRGRLGGRPAPPRLGFLATFVKRDGEWRQLSRALVPQAPPPGGPPGRPGAP